MSNFKEQFFSMPVNLCTCRELTFYKAAFLKRQVVLIVLFVIIFSAICLAQNTDTSLLLQKAQINLELVSRRETIDSLKKIMISANETTRINCLNLMSPQYYSLNTDTAWTVASNAYDLAVKINYKKGLGESLLNLAQITQERGNIKGAEKYFRQANNLYNSGQSRSEWSYTNYKLGYNLSLQLRFDEARTIYLKTLPYYLEINDEEHVAYLYKLIAITYDHQGYYEKAFEYFQKDMDIIRGTKDGLELRRSSFMWSNYYIGALFKDAGDYKSASIYYRLSMQRAKENKLPDVYNERMGDLYVLQNNFDSGRYYYEAAHYLVSERIIDPVIRKYFLSDPKVNIGETYLAQKNYNKALEYFKEPLQYSFPANFLTMRVSYDVASIFEGQNKFTLALQYAKQLLEIAHVAGARQYICDGLELFWRIYDQQRKTDSAYKYHLQYSIMKDSITRDKQLRNIALSEMKANTEIQQSRIELLNKEKEIQQVQLRREMLQKKILFAGILVLSLAGFILFRNIILKRHDERLKLSNQIKIEQLEGAKAKAELQQQANELEMQALRAQMNPHFIFNSLSAINMFILENNKLKASEYLSKFSKLIRLILQNSQEAFILLEKELEALQLYLELESLRFENKFEYKILTEEDMDIAMFKVPPLVIQPYAENAIWHGLMHKKGKGHLQIELYWESEILFCKISDDGIGRRSASELKSKTTLTHKSMGMSITADRIAMLLQKNQKETFITINDLVLPDGNAAGTEVIIKIPICYD